MIRVIVVAVIAKLTLREQAIAAARFSAKRRTLVIVSRITVIAVLAGLHYAITTFCGDANAVFAGC